MFLSILKKSEIYPFLSPAQFSKLIEMNENKNGKQKNKYRWQCQQDSVKLNQINTDGTYTLREIDS